MRRRRATLEPIDYGEVQVDLARRRVTRAGHRIDLSPREFDLLLALVRAQGELVSRQTLLADVWDMDFDPGTNVLDVHVGRLRRKIDSVGGPLIQILIEQGEVGRAAAIALDIVEALSEEDARQMVTIASDADSYQWASRLSEALFERTGLAEDAYHAARNRALEGDDIAAFILLRRAVAAGFSDAARLWSDAALEKLHGVELEALLPPPLEQ